MVESPRQMDRSEPNWELEFYGETDTELGPVKEWIKKELSPLQRRALGKAMELFLQPMGPGVCDTAFGTRLSGGLFEFRLDKSEEQVLQMLGLLPEGKAPAKTDRILIRVFCHAHGDRLIVLLAGYDKLKDPSNRQQNDQIKIARGRLAELQSTWRRSRRNRAENGGRN